MSRYDMEAIEAEYDRVTVGWDNPLQTLFAQVWDLIQEDEEDAVLWVGCEPRSLTSVTALAQPISAYAVLPAETAARLEQDQAAAKPPTPLQQWGLSRLTQPVDVSSGRRSTVDYIEAGNTNAVNEKGERHATSGFRSRGHMEHW